MNVFNKESKLYLLFLMNHGVCNFVINDVTKCENLMCTILLLFGNMAVNLMFISLISFDTVVDGNHHSTWGDA